MSMSAHLSGGESGKRSVYSIIYRRLNGGTSPFKVDELVEMLGVG